MSFEKIIYRLTNKRIPEVTGIGLAGDILERANFQNWFINLESTGKRSKKQIDTGSVLTTFIVLLVHGQTKLRERSGMAKRFGVYSNSFASQKRISFRGDTLAEDGRHWQIAADTLLNFYTHLLKRNGIEPTPQKNGMVPVDMDITPMDNSNTKRKVSHGHIKSLWVIRR